MTTCRTQCIPRTSAPPRRTATFVLAVATFALATLAALPTAALHAQGPRVGAIVGANFARLDGLDDVDLDKRTGVVGGLSLLFPLGTPWSLQTEALLVTAGAEPGSGGGDGITLTYAQVPVLFRLSVAPGASLSPHVYAGPYLGFRIRCRVDVSGPDSDCEDAPGVSTQSVDVGGIAGGGLDLRVGGLILTGGVRYGFGVSKVAEFEFDSVRESARNGSFAVYTGLSVPLGGR